MRRHMLAAVVALLAVAPAAHAGPRFAVGAGTDPHVLVDPATGTAHVVWLSGNATMECNVPRGSKSCTAQAVDMRRGHDRVVQRRWQRVRRPA